MRQTSDSTHRYTHHFLSDNNLWNFYCTLSGKKISWVQYSALDRAGSENMAVLPKLSIWEEKGKSDLLLGFSKDNCDIKDMP